MDIKLETREDFDRFAREVRYIVTDMICKAGSGHIGGALSIVEIVITLYYRIMNVRAEDPRWEDRDRFVLSKGHAGPTLYTVLAYKGYFPFEWLTSMNKNGTMLPSHVDQRKTPGIDQTAGSLGQGISCAVGLAISAKISKKKHHVYCIIGDGESQEGQVWESAMFAAHKKLDNLIVIADNNSMQIDSTVKEINDIEPYPDKWKAFGWEVFVCDGHDWDQLMAAFEKAKAVNGKPSIIIAKTVKGKGNSCVEGTVASHNIKVTNESDYKKFIGGVASDGVKVPY
jgi:transketolase